MTNIENNNWSDVLQHEMETDIEAWSRAMDQDTYQREGLVFQSSEE